MKTIIRIPQGAHRSLLPSFRRGWTWLLFLMASVLLTSCRDYYDETATEQQNTEDMAILRINVYAPTSDSYSTRAEDTDPATNDERTMHDLKVWAFLSSAGNDAVAIGYASKSGLNQYEEYQWLEMGLPKGVIRQSLDFYAIANATGTGFEEIDGLGTTPTRSQLENAKFTAFGTTNAVTGSVPATGLPASRILKGVEFPNASENIVSEANQLSILLLRAVCKYRFFFAKPVGLEAQITKIELNENVLPTSELIMPEASNSNDALPHTNSVALPANATKSSALLTYANTGSTPLLANAAIKAVASPENYIKSNTENFTKYIARLTNQETGVTEYANGLTYIRESDAPLTGKIYYKIGSGAEKPADFVLQTEDIDDHNKTEGGQTVKLNCFPRNHYSVVYAYFQGGSLQVKPIVNDWIAGTTHSIISATDAALSISKTYTQGWYDYVMWSSEAVTYQTIDWDKNYCAVSYGYDADAGNRPKFATAFFVRSTSSNQLHIMCDNNAFGFITYTTGQQDYSAIQDEIIIPPGKRDYQTDFYLVPRHQLSLSESRYVNMMLVEDLGAGMSLQRLPFNHVLPGPASGETARLYYVTPDEYEQAINNRNTIQTLTSGGVIFTYGDGN
ncbi:MAG: hypothetical protein K6A96_02940 [Prevotella sp.]|nr:hypothetical protein [Prevotella sp.]